MSTARELDDLAAPLGYTVRYREGTAGRSGSYRLQVIDGDHVVIITPDPDDVRREMMMLAESDVWELRRGEVIQRIGLLTVVVEIEGIQHRVSGDMAVGEVSAGSIVLTRTGEEPAPKGMWTKAPLRPEPIVRSE
ncbi:hypothetical protein [Rhodococcoides corynebacterioides]|uniref:Uncharacterized protein n=1 Tax=Rhodococcoides corynebacterioides TaxID=53972 RepID=A0ABS7P102_9NOCA|nr:hypothetical protein [Rhodococcus corynebacterioides]MBY6350616.1 hypothetical protein [Rhodococcus corynebacterioides]MBY6366070.1 hypothetical protein [Rhodococcus corynebacterioides]MBY6406972.1 hypothetical protein [Rhodococcus corynebacterioides]